MYRERVLLLGVGLAVAASLAALAGMGYLGWQSGLRQEQSRLQDHAARAIERARAAFEEVDEAFDELERSTATPCSPRHIEELRRATLDTRSAEDVGYFRDGRLQCSSWGALREQVPRAAIEFTTVGAIGVSTRVQPRIRNAPPMLVLHRGSYSALVNPERLVDVLAEDDVRIALHAPGDQPLTAASPAVEALLARVGKDASGGTVAGQLYGVSRRDGWEALAARPLAAVAGRLRGEQLKLLPLALIVLAALAALSTWLIRQRLSPLAELERAVRRRQFVVHYQPIVDLRSGACVGAEALVRWRREGALVPPDSFIPLAEESGWIAPITDQVLDGVVADLEAELAADRSLHIAINLGAEDIRSGRFLRVLDEVLPRTRIRADQIWLEATERGFIDIEAARLTLAQARAAGHSVAIDDFGTGYSSLRHLQDLPLDALKIDKSFVDTIGLEAATSPVTAHIVEMARALDLHIVAEGVETQAQRDYLRSREVGYAQGWYFSRPLRAAEFIAFLRRSRATHGAGPEVIRRPER
ncbi:EAL domain-containing protein [Pseudoxanthomonas sp.]|uniref:EAL domain-containing protein n=1 Tax=Pseudoxanthomonas sp. TaxID=1871049 RepID=UPI003F818A98